MGHGLKALLASTAAAASLTAAHHANEFDADRWRTVLLESIDGGLLVEHDWQQQEAQEHETDDGSAAAPGQRWMQLILTNVAGQQASCTAAAVLNIQWQRHMQRMLPRAAAAALDSAASSRSCSAGGYPGDNSYTSFQGHSCSGSVSCPGSSRTAAAEMASGVPSVSQRLQSSSSSIQSSPSSNICDHPWALLSSTASSSQTGQPASSALPAERPQAAHLRAQGTRAPPWSTPESATEHQQTDYCSLFRTTQIMQAGEACSGAGTNMLAQPQQQQQQQQRKLVIESSPAGDDVGEASSSALTSPPKTPNEQRQHFPLGFALQCSSEQFSPAGRCSEQQQAGSGSSSSVIDEVPQQEGPCTSLLSHSSRSSSTADMYVDAANTEVPASCSSGGSIDLLYSLRTMPDVTSQEEDLTRTGAETHHALGQSAERLQQQQQQQEQLLQLLPLLPQLQRFEELASSLSQAEARSAAVQQHCSSLSSDNSQLRAKEARARAQARQLAVRHDACLSKLMQAQQQLEQQRLQLKASQRAASQRLQQLLQLVQAKQQQALVARAVTEEGSSSAPQQQQEAQEQQQQVDEQQTQRMGAAFEQQQQQQQQQPAAEPKGGLSSGVEWLWQLVSELESSTLEVIGSRAQDMAPLQQLQQQVQQLTRELQQAVEAVTASAAEKQQLQRARDGLSLKLAESQRQLLQKDHDLTAVTNDRLTIAASKTKLHHQLQGMQLQQQELVLAGQQALEAAELNAQRADQLQQQLAVLQAAVSAAESARQKSDQELKLAQSECENGLHQVAQLQLELQAAKVQHSKALQELQQQLACAAEQQQQQQQQQLQGQLAAQEEQERKLGEQMQQLQQQLLASGVAEGSSRQQVLQLQQQLDGSAAEIKQLQQQLATKSGRDVSLQETQQLQQKLQAAAADKQRLQQQLSAAQTECIAAQQQLVQVRKEAAGLKMLLVDADAAGAEMQQQLQASQQEVKVQHENADMESSQLVEALKAAQARITGSTQQVVEAQLDVTQLAQVAELQQQQLLWQQDVIHKLRSVVPRAQLQLLLPDLDACSSACTSPAVSPRPGTAAHSRAATPSRPMSPLVRPTSPCKPLQQQQQHEPIRARASTPDAARFGATSAAPAAAAAVHTQGSLQLPSFLMPQLTDDGAAAVCAAGNPLFAPTVQRTAVVQQLPASSLWGKDTAESSCCVTGNMSSWPAVMLPAPVKEQASCMTSSLHVPQLPVVEGNARQAATGGSSISSGQRSGRRNSSTCISANGSSSVVLARTKSQANAKSRNGAAGTTAAAVATAVPRPRLVPNGLPDRLERHVQGPAAL